METMVITTGETPPTGTIDKAGNATEVSSESETPTPALPVLLSTAPSISTTAITLPCLPEEALIMPPLVGEPPAPAPLQNLRSSSPAAAAPSRGYLMEEAAPVTHKVPLPPPVPRFDRMLSNELSSHQFDTDALDAVSNPSHPFSSGSAISSTSNKDLEWIHPMMSGVGTVILHSPCAWQGGPSHNDDNGATSISHGSNNSVSSSTANGCTSTAGQTTTTAIVQQVTTKSKGGASKKIPHIPAAASHIDGLTDATDRIRLGICAMDKKARSKPMAEILSRLDENLFEVVFFSDDVILNKPIEEWPICRVVIAFFSKGYPLPKAKAYVALRKPFILNDLDTQELLQDRRRVYDLLEAAGIDVPRHVYLSRDGYISTGSGDGNGGRDPKILEFDDHIEVNGIIIHKPFVEKPTNAEDHNISIYYPTSAGGGCKKLFRKIGNRSSEFYPDINEVRRDGNYIYEEFVETQGTDVKMYTVGPEYGHAEARKSPAVDGKVERNPDGKEVRFPVILTFREKEIARRIVLNFKQFVCGFDILRVQEGHSVISYVCDVNGWSFVKNSRKYYDDCAQILSEHILALVKPAAFKTFSTLGPLVTTSLNRLDEEIMEDVQQQQQQQKKRETFLSRAARMLQGAPSEDEEENQENRSLTPNNVNPSNNNNSNNLSATSDGTGGSPLRSETSELLSSAAATLMEGALPVREFPNNLTSNPASIAPSANSSVEDESNERTHIKRSSSFLLGSHQEELRCVLAIVRHGDRSPKEKIKINVREPHILAYFHKYSEDCKKDLKVKAKAPLTEFLETIKSALSDMKRDAGTETLRYQFLHIRDILERWKIVGLNRKLQLKPRKFEEYIDESDSENKERCIEAQLILKWGGNLTKLGEKQSVSLGQRLRHEMYPDAPGGGILRLHSTFRHDLKIKTSDEGRVMKTAAAFAKGLLELEGDLPPILVSLVHKERGSMHMLDPSGNKEVKMELDECKEKITTNLQRDIDVTTASEEDLESLVGPRELTSLREALQRAGNPRQALFKIHQIIGELITQLGQMLGSVGSGDEKIIEGGEGLEGEADDDVALSGVKLYKGETLLELTERWRFLYDRLYDPESDLFDLSRIPDVHDNVRFDVLHNPHLGLTDTLHHLYETVKIMADCVVPQEYGTTIAEKRSVGVKICHGLLEKIKYDLSVARHDNEVDMRYMINMDYSADLPISTLGRRIRTRLYFTSESHLHTVLNVLRYGSEDGMKSLLSEHGIQVINGTPELCYLTQIVFRVFEDSRREMNDRRRFRVEILFSPGATATPLHIHENERDTDKARVDTSPLQMIGRDGLTCQEVEDFCEKAIMAGRGNDDATYEVASTSTAAEGFHLKPKKKKKKPVVEDEGPIASVDNQIVDPIKSESSHDIVSTELDAASSGLALSPIHTDEEPETDRSVQIRDDPLPGPDVPTITEQDLPEKDDAGDDKEPIIVKNPTDELRKLRDRKYFWNSVAVCSLVVGTGCLLMALRLSSDSRQRRRWTRHR